MPLPGEWDSLWQGKFYCDGTMIGGESLIVHYGEWRINEGKSPCHEVIDFDPGGRRGESLGALFLGKNEKARGSEPRQ